MDIGRIIMETLNYLGMFCAFGMVVFIVIYKFKQNTRDKNDDNSGGYFMP